MKSRKLVCLGADMVVVIEISDGLGYLSIWQLARVLLQSRDHVHVSQLL